MRDRNRYDALMRGLEDARPREFFSLFLFCLLERARKKN